LASRTQLGLPGTRFHLGLRAGQAAGGPAGRRLAARAGDPWLRAAVELRGSRHGPERVARKPAGLARRDGSDGSALIARRLGSDCQSSIWAPPSRGRWRCTPPPSTSASCGAGGSGVGRPRGWGDAPVMLCWPWLVWDGPRCWAWSSGRLPSPAASQAAPAGALAFSKSSSYLALSLAFFAFCLVLWMLYGWLPNGIDQRLGLSLARSCFDGFLYFLGGRGCGRAARRAAGRVGGTPCRCREVLHGRVRPDLRTDDRQPVRQPMMRLPKGITAWPRVH
jgi:hypothetical protein